MTSRKIKLDFLHQRLSEVKVHNRKDVNVMVDWVVTLPQSLNNKKFVMMRAIFQKKTYKFWVRDKAKKMLDKCLLSILMR